MDTQLASYFTHALNIPSLGFEAQCATLICLILCANVGIADIRNHLQANTNSPNATDAYGRTALIHTCASRRPNSDQVSIIHWLLAAGANVNHQDINGLTPLATLLQKPNARINIEAVRVLLAAGADPNICDINGISPLMLAVRSSDIKQRIELAQILINAKANLNHHSQSGIDVLGTAILNYSPHGGLDLVAMLIKAGANINYQETGSQSTALMWVALRSELEFYVELAKLLIESGADVRLRDAYSRSAITFTLPYYTPAQNQHTLAIRSMIEAKLKTYH